MRRALLTAVLLAGGARAASGQSVTPSNEELGGRGYFLIGLHWLDLGDLNRSLRATGYPSLDEDRLTIGGGGLGSRGRWLIGGEGIGSIGGSKTRAADDYRIRLDGGYGLFQIGYLAHTTPTIDIYPLLGLGGGGVSLTITERSTPSFDDVLTVPGRSSHLGSGSVLVSLSGGLDYRIRGKKKGGMLIGVRAGWLFGFARSEWSLEGKYDVSNGPDVTLGGPFIRVAIGGWGTHARRSSEAK